MRFELPINPKNQRSGTSSAGVVRHRTGILLWFLGLTGRYRRHCVRPFRARGGSLHPKPGLVSPGIGCSDPSGLNIAASKLSRLPSFKTLASAYESNLHWSRFDVILFASGKSILTKQTLHTFGACDYASAQKRLTICLVFVDVDNTVFVRHKSTHNASTRVL